MHTKWTDDNYKITLPEPTDRTIYLELLGNFCFDDCEIC